MERIAPSGRLEAQIAELLSDELGANAEKLAELGRLRARLVLQRAVEDEVTAFLGEPGMSGRPRPLARATAPARSESRPPKASSR